MVRRTQKLNGFWLAALMVSLVVLRCATIAAQDAAGTNFKFLEVTVLNPDGQPAAATDVELNVGGLEFPMATDEKGIVSLNLPADSFLALVIRKQGCMPVTKRWRRGGHAPAEYTIQLQQAEPVVGEVVDEHGDAVESAKVFTATAGESLKISNGRADSGAAPTAITDSAGQFSLAYPEQGLMVVCLHPSGWAQLAGIELASASPKRIQLLPWSRVEGIVRRGQHLVANKEVWAEPCAPSPLAFGSIRWIYHAETDKEGVFSFDRVVAGSISVGKLDYCRRLTEERFPLRSIDMLVTTSPGETTRVPIGGSGQTVVGKLVSSVIPVGGVDWRDAHVKLEADNPLQRVWGSAVFEYGKLLGVGNAFRPGTLPPDDTAIHVRQRYMATIDSDGNFEISDVPAGRYEISAQLFTQRDAKRTLDATARPKSCVVVVAGEEAQQLGEIELDVIVTRLLEE